MIPFLFQLQAKEQKIIAQEQQLQEQLQAKEQAPNKPCDQQNTSPAQSKALLYAPLLIFNSFKCFYYLQIGSSSISYTEYSCSMG